MNTTDPTKSDYAGPCARCGGLVPSTALPGAYPGALSRYDNTTYICSSCGSEEALYAGHLIPFDVSPYGETAQAIRDAAQREAFQEAAKKKAAK